MNSLMQSLSTFISDKVAVTKVYIDVTPEEPDEMIAIIEYTGGAQHYVDEHVLRSVQVVSRSIDASMARQKSLGIYEAIRNAQGEDGRVDFTPDCFGQVFLRQTPFKIRTDANNRSYYCFNIGITTTIY